MTVIKAVRSPLSSLDAFDQTIRIPRRARLADWETSRIVLSGVIHQILFEKIECLSDLGSVFSCLKSGIERGLKFKGSLCTW